MRRLNQSGAVSLLSVVIFSTIVTISITAYIRSAISQQNEASNYDYGTRAYYAAESGVQDAVRAINTDATIRSNGKDKCKSLVDGTATNSGAGLLGGEDFGLAYTCQLITTEPSELTGTVSDSSNDTLLLNPKSPEENAQYNVIIKWSKTDQDSATELRGKTNPTKAVYPVGMWENSDGTRIHPMMRVSVVSVPKGTFERKDIKQNTFFLNPVSTEPTEGDTVTNLAGQPRGSVNVDTRCYSSKDNASPYGGFSCQREIKLVGFNFTSNNVYLRLHSIYDTTGYSASLVKNGTTTPIKLTNSQATIDVTGRSSNVYRRVKQTVPLSSDQTDNLPEAALVAGDGICKLFQIGNTASQFQWGCNPLGTD